MEELNNTLKTESLEREKQFSEKEQQEKLILEFCFLKSQIEKIEIIDDEKNRKIINKLLKNFEKNLENTLKLNISAKDKETYLQLKNSNLDSNAKKLTKYL